MTHYVKHQYDELLPPIMPGLEIHIIYNCVSEITFGDDGEEENNRIITIEARFNGEQIPLVGKVKFPEEKDGADARKFLAILRDSARQALWAEALRQAKDAGYTDPQEINTVAYNWQRLGVAELLPGFSKSRSFIE